LGLADRIDSSRDSLIAPRRHPCGLGVALALLDEVDRQALQGALDNPRLRGTDLAKLINAEGEALAAELSTAAEKDLVRLEQLAPLCARMSVDMVQRHRRGACGCESSGVTE
jgi:hypothetical protein